jgi:LAGLIDADG endonuclease
MNILDYAAGFIDGEGCFNIGRQRSAFAPRIMVVNTNLKVLEKFQAAFGGDIVRTEAKNQPTWKPRYTWRLSHWKALELAEQLYSRLVIKKKQAFAFILWSAIQELFSPNERYDQYSKVKDYISVLNRKGR